jgi:hypothetical protein
MVERVQDWDRSRKFKSIVIWLKAQSNMGGFYNMYWAKNTIAIEYRVLTNRRRRDSMKLEIFRNPMQTRNQRRHVHRLIDTRSCQTGQSHTRNVEQILIYNRNVVVLRGGTKVVG